MSNWEPLLWIQTTGDLLDLVSHSFLLHSIPTEKNHLISFDTSEAFGRIWDGSLQAKVLTSVPLSFTISVLGILIPTVPLECWFRQHGPVLQLTVLLLLISDFLFSTFTPVQSFSDVSIFHRSLLSLSTAATSNITGNSSARC